MGTDPAGHPILLEDLQRCLHVYLLGKSGVGKTMLLALIVLQDLLRGASVVFFDLIGTAVPYLRLCLAASNLSGIARERGMYRALNQRLRREREAFFRRVRIVDLDRVDTPDRFNPFQPVPGMTTAELAESFAAAIERMLGGKLSEMRALHLNLVALGAVLIDTGGATVADMVELCCAGEETLRNYLRLLERKKAAGQLRIPLRPDLVERYMSGFFAATSGRERRELCASTLRALAIILSDPVAARFLSSPVGNVDLEAVLREGKSLLINVPPQNLHTQAVISGLLLGRLSALAMRRRSEDVSAGRLPQIHVVIDEFQRCFTEELAADLAVLRNKGLSLILAHQSSNQPPFHTPEGQAMLHSVRDNCSTKALMRMGPKDAEELAGECFLPAGHLVKREVEEVTRTQGESSGNTTSLAEANSCTSTHGSSQTSSVTESSSSALSHSESEAVGHQTTRTEGRSQTTTHGESEASSWTTSQGETRGSSRTHSEGQGSASSQSSGTGQSQSSGSGRSSGSQRSQGRNVGPQFATQSLQTSSGTSEGLSFQESSSDSSTQSRGQSESHTSSDARGISRSSSRSQSTGRTSTQSRSESESLSQSHAEGESRTSTLGQSRSETQGHSVGTSDGESRSESEGRTRTVSEGRSRQRSEGTSVRESIEYYSVIEERIVRSYELQSLPNRSAVVLLQGNGAVTVQRLRTPDMPIAPVTRIGPIDGLADLERLIAPPPAEDAPTLNIFDRLRAQQISLMVEEES